MAARFWVGGAGTWDATSTVHWSATSGGAAGASAPTSADTATFDILSNATAYAVTIGLTASPAACLDVSIAGPAVGNVAITFAATSVLNVFGSWLSAAAGVVFSCPIAGGTVNFSATTTGKTIATNNITFGLISILFNGAGGEWKLTTGFTSTAQLTANAGIFDTDGKALSIGTFATTSNNPRSILLRASVISLNNNVSINSVVNLTLFDAGTSTISSAGTAPLFTGGGQTFYNVNFTSATAAINSVAITGANTFNNLNVTTTTLQKIIQLGANQIVNGTLTLGATNTATFRMSVVSDVVGTQRTLTVATLATLADVDFRDIVAAGASAASPWSGTRIGNCLGNSNITFTAAATKYWNFAAGGIWNSTAWALTSGGAVAVNNFPLPQDTAIIDDAGLTAGNTINISTNADIGTLSMATRTTALTLALGNADPRFYGNVTFCSSLTTTGTSSPTYQFQGQGLANTLNTAGVTLALSQLNVNCPTGSLTLLSNATIELTASTSGTAILSAGTFNLNGFNLTAVAFGNSTATTRTFTQGTGTVNITGNNGAIWSSSNATGLTYTTRPVVNFTYAGSTGSRTITTNAASIIDANITAGTDNVILATAVGNLNFTGFAGSFANNTRAIYGDLTLASGMTVTSGALGTTFDRTGTQTITSGTQTFTNLLLQSQSFNTAPWVRNNMTVTQDTTVSPSGATDADTILTLVAGAAVTQNSAAFAAGSMLTASVYAQKKTSPYVRFELGNTVSCWYNVNTGVIGSNGAGSGNYLFLAKSITSVGGGWYRLVLTITTTTVTSAGIAIYATETDGNSSSVNSDAYLWGAQLEINGTATTYIPTTTTTASITGNRIIDFPIAFSNSGTTNCLDALTLGSTRGLTLTDGTLNLAASTTSTVGAFATTGTTAKFLGSTTPGTQATISDASGTNTVSYLTIQDSAATGGAIWQSTVTVIDAGNNTGWSFPPPALVAGVVATGYIGIVVPSGDVGITGVVGYGQIGFPPVWGLIDTAQAANWQLIVN